MRIRTGTAVNERRFRRDVGGAVPYDGVRSCIRRGRRLGGPSGTGKFAGASGTSGAPSLTAGFDHAFVGADAPGGPLGTGKVPGIFPAGA